MVDAVGGAAKIVQVALKIKEAANTVHQNKEDCDHIKSRVDILNRTLSHYVNNPELMADYAVVAALEALDEILIQALEVIIECQEKRNIICIYYTAGNLSQQLSKVEQRISYLSSDAMLTIMSYQLLNKSQEYAPDLPLRPTVIVEVHVSTLFISTLDPTVIVKVCHYIYFFYTCDS
jgi:hypothetical protein